MDFSVPISTWPKYNKVNRKAYVLDGVTHHETRLETDIRGQFCRLINEANNFVRGGLLIFDNYCKTVENSNFFIFFKCDLYQIDAKSEF